MATAQIVFQQADSNLTPGSRDDLVLNVPVVMLNSDNTGTTQWLWTLVDKPTGSTATIASPTASTTTFTPDITGTYLIKLVLNGGTPTDQKGAAVKTANYNYRIPAALETIEFDNSRGWAIAANFALQIIDDGYVPPSGSTTLQNVYDSSSPARITLNNTNSTFIIQDASTPTGSTLFEVDQFGGSTKYLSTSSVATILIGNLLQTGGKTGLGTNTPGASYTNLIPDLNVHMLKTGHDFLLIETATASSDVGIALYTAASNADSAIFLDESDSQKLKIAMGVVDTDASRNSNTKLTLTQAGAVGIGTSAPSTLLHVAGTGTFTGALGINGGFTSGASSSMGGFKITNLATPTDGYDATTKNYVDGQVATAGNLSGSLTSTRVPYATGTNTLADNGNFTWTNASSVLAVDGLRFGGSTGDDPNTIGSAADTSQILILGGAIGSNTHGGGIRLGGGTRVDGYVGVIQFIQQSVEIARFQGDNTNGNAGSLGIGTLNPVYKLDVIGSGHLDTSLLVGSIPTNDPTIQFLVNNQSSNPVIGLQGHLSAAPSPSISFFDSLAALRSRIVGGIEDGYIAIEFDGDLSSGDGYFAIKHGLETDGYALVVSNDGYVGINTDAPSEALEVNGKIKVAGSVINPALPSAGDALVYDGSEFVPLAVVPPLVHDNSNLLLTTTSPTVVISMTPPYDGDMVVFAYFRVIDTTDLEIVATWNDAGGAQSYELLPDSSQGVGSVSIAPLYIQGSASSSITITATAGTASRAYVSGSVMMLVPSNNAAVPPAVAEMAEVYNYELTTDDPTNVLSFTPSENENYFVYIYYRVVNSTTDVAINLSFDDESGPQTMAVLSPASKLVGSYSIAPIYIQATTAAPINVEFTSGTAGNVFVSATILIV